MGAGVAVAGAVVAAGKAGGKAAVGVGQAANRYQEYKLQKIIIRLLTTRSTYIALGIGFATGLLLGWSIPRPNWVPKLAKFISAPIRWFLPTPLNTSNRRNKIPNIHSRYKRNPHKKTEIILADDNSQKMIGSKQPLAKTTRSHVKC